MFYMWYMWVDCYYVLSFSLTLFPRSGSMPVPLLRVAPRSQLGCPNNEPNSETRSVELECGLKIMKLMFPLVMDKCLCFFFGTWVMISIYVQLYNIYI